MKHNVTVADRDLLTVKERFVRYYANLQPVRDNAGIDTVCEEDIISLQKPDGSWADIDYLQRERSRWPAATLHLGRLNALVRQWRRSQSADAAHAVHLSLDFWLKNDFVNPNWWWNDIGVPQLLGRTLLLFEDELTDYERTNGISRLARTQSLGLMTGQNRLWIADIHFQRALLIGDSALLELSAKTETGEICISSGEGIREDWIFHQHGCQPQMGNYGLSFVESMTLLDDFLANTSYAINDEQHLILENLLSFGYEWIIWNGYLDVASIGRQFYPKAQEYKAATVIKSMKRFWKEDFERRPQKTGFRYFEKSAFAVYRTDKWMVSVKAATPEIVGVETWVNEDNIKGENFADGSLFFYVTGREYADIFPLWEDWDLLPGITSYSGRSPVRGRAANDNRNVVSGCRTDNGGIFELKLDRRGLKADKTWKFSNEGVICEGSCITSQASEEVVTCVEFALAAENAAVVLESDDKFVAVNGQVRYEIEAPCGSVRCRIEEREGDFKSIMGAIPSTPVKAKVFILTISHGVKPVNASYRYRISTSFSHK